MLQRFVANWLRQHAQEAILQGLRPGEEAASQGDATVGEPELVDVACFFSAAKQAAGLADLMTASSQTQCHGFVERIGTVANRRVAIIESELPHEQLARVIHDVIRLRKPGWVLASGFARAIAPQVGRGHLLVANRLVDSNGYSLAIDNTMPKSKALHVAPLLTVGEMPKISVPMAEQSPAGAFAQDTQAAVVGEVCRILKTKMMAVHCVSAVQGQPEPVVTKKIKSQDSLAGIVGAAAGALIEKPSSMKDLWRDKEASLVFSDRLAKFLASVMKQLPRERE